MEPSTQDDAFSSGYAPITLLKQMRTSTGRPRALMGGVGGFLPGFPGRPLTWGPALGSAFPGMPSSRMRGPATAAAMGRGGGGGGGMFFGGSPFDSPPITPGFGLGSVPGVGGGYQMFGTGPGSDSGNSSR